jgi:hypothetical protein
MMMMKNALMSVLAATAISTPVIIAPAIVSPAAAQATLSFGVTIGVPPPAPVYEVVPAPRAGFVWAPGYWYWDGGRHLWAPGRWMAERPGYHWVPDRWAHVEGGWHHEYGHWDHDVVRHGWNR